MEMQQTPEDVVQRAYTALAEGDFDALISLIDRSFLERMRDARLAVAHALESVRTASNRPAHDSDALLREWGVRSLEELGVIDPSELLRRGLQQLPAVRSTLRCEIVGRTLDTNELAVVAFFVRWRGDATSLVPLREAHLHMTDEGWRLRPLLLSRWVLPGMENTLFAESPAEGRRG